MPFSLDQYAQLAADAQGEIAATITGVVTEGDPPVQKALVLTEDPVSLDETQWLAALLSDNDTDANGDKRAHAWVVTFAGTEQEEDAGIKDIQAVLTYRVQVFYRHEPAHDDYIGSEAIIRGEVMRAQFALAKRPDFGMDKVGRHYNLRMPIRLTKMGGTIIHRGDGELRVSLHPIGT